MSETEVFVGWKDDASLIREAKAKANLNVSEPIPDRENSTTDYTTSTSEATASFGMRTINWLVGRQKTSSSSICICNMVCGRTKVICIKTNMFCHFTFYNQKISIPATVSLLESLPLCQSTIFSLYYTSNFLFQLSEKY